MAEKKIKATEKKQSISKTKDTKIKNKPLSKTPVKATTKPVAKKIAKPTTKKATKETVQKTPKTNVKSTTKKATKETAKERKPSKATASNKKPSAKTPSKATKQEPYPFEIGEHIFYPNEGMGLILDIEHLELKGETIPYFVISFPAQKMVNRVPIKNAKLVKIRKTISKQMAKNVLKKLDVEPEKLDMPWKDRLAMYQAINEKGNSLEAAEMILSLYFRRQIKTTLSFQERQIFEFALVALGSEIAIVLGISKDEALLDMNTRIKNTYEQSLKSKDESNQDTKGT